MKQFREGTLWIFANEILEKMKEFEPGELVEIYNRKDVFFGTGYINPHSLIAVRILSPAREEIGFDFFYQKISQALEFRKRFVDETSCRLVYSESDGLPGLIIDRYDNALSLQILTAGMERYQDIIIEVLEKLFSPEVILLKNESRAREQEGLPQFSKLVKGVSSEVIFSEGGVRFRVDLLAGQKTGFFLDQRDNRIEFARLLRGGKGLDLFCYHGGWGLQLLKTGNEVTFVDSSAKAVESARENSVLNGLEAKASFLQADVFDFLKTAEPEQYDFIVFDPPAFIKSKAKFQEGYRAYRDLNARCMKLLKKGGLLATSSCSHHLHRESFIKMITEAAVKSGRSVKMLALRGQPADHPVYLAMPETEYLKCAFLYIE